MNNKVIYDLAIVGGGLAGLALSIQMARKGFNVVLFEKKKYPFHRVCGEYISHESWNFLHSLSIDLEKLNVSNITSLLVADVNGSSFKQLLPLGGFGISRYKLDFSLYQLAKQSGVIIYEQTCISDIHFNNELFELTVTGSTFKAKMAAGCYGKRSKMDVKWKRPFISVKKKKHPNYIGVKYHIRYNFPEDQVALYHFKNGYCGLSKIEDDQYCLCYLTNAANLEQSSNDINLLEKNILSANPHLKEIFNTCEKIHGPEIISQISFSRKTAIENHVLMIGDAAGMITPLCGNGMSMALHASKIAAEEIHLFLSGLVSREEMEKKYSDKWRKLFATRLCMGRIFQHISGNQWLMSRIVKLGRTFPSLLKFFISHSHGRTF